VRHEVIAASARIWVSFGVAAHERTIAALGGLVVPVWRRVTTPGAIANPRPAATGVSVYFFS